MNKPSNSAISAGLLFAVLLWGANNAGTKFLIGYWPPIFVGATRFILAGLILLALFRWTKFFGTKAPLSKELKRKLWWRGGLNLALYIIAFNWALTMTSVSHVALYLGASPVWALLWEGKPDKSWKSFLRYFAAALALCGVFVLFWPALKIGSSHLLGELVALGGSVLWTNYGRQCRAFAQELSGAEISAYTFWRAGVLLMPIAIFEIAMKPPVLRTDLVLIQTFCVLASGVVAFALWNNALRYWKTSKVYLFNNLIPLSSMTWAHIFLGEQITKTFWFAMILIVAGVLISQTNWQKIFGKRWLPVE
ncbi:MAG: DMT family transporter [Verrucomicrobiota bacterium]